MPDNVKQQLWKISLSSASIYGADMDFDIIKRYRGFWRKASKGKMVITKEILCGVPNTTSIMLLRSDNERIKKFLVDTFNISSSEDLKTRIEEFINVSFVTKDFSIKRQHFISLPYKEKVSLLNSSKNDNHEYIRYSILSKYDKLLPASGIYAFDLSNSISICRLGVYLDYLEKDEAYEYINKCAVMAKKNYSSFEEFGIAATVGLLFFGDKSRYVVYSHYLERLKKILTHNDSYWTNLDWT